MTRPRSRSRALRLLMSFALITGGATAAGTAPAAAAPVGPMACYDQAVSYETTAIGERHRWPSTGWATTSPHCNDINVKALYRTDVRVCFRATDTCNGVKTAYAGTWILAATNVRDGTAYHLSFSSWSVGEAAA
ncbi:hypothetical protein [Streptomyces profundus]|uniref:hypothetical protein n=1 Tax=Streptomyces profundus TaxID=2867410 RepID=UPI001D169EC7|nr:hypothetical protein [Streptomyces sp. MA3_2.13]UED86792.1 hypothetical protein K4G22_23465 [Streptomyces sp. MA3_2.13]